MSMILRLFGSSVFVVPVCLCPVVFVPVFFFCPGLFLGAALLVLGLEGVLGGSAGSAEFTGCVGPAKFARSAREATLTPTSPIVVWNVPVAHASNPMSGLALHLLRSVLLSIFGLAKWWVPTQRPQSL